MSSKTTNEDLRPAIDAIACNMKECCQKVWEGEQSEAAHAPPSHSKTEDQESTCPSDMKKEIDEMFVASLDELRAAINSKIKKLPLEVAQAEGRENMIRFIEATKAEMKQVIERIIDEKSERIYNMLADRSQKEVEAVLGVWEATFGAGFTKFSDYMVRVLFNGLPPIMELGQEIARKCNVMVGEVDAVYEKGSSGH